MLIKSLRGTAGLLLAFIPAGFVFAQTAPILEASPIAATAPAENAETPSPQTQPQALADPVVPALIPALEEKNLSIVPSAEAPTASAPAANVPPTEPADIVVPQNLPADIPAYVPPQIIDAAQSDLWERIRKGYGLSNFDSPLIGNHVNWYAGRPDYFQRMTDRSARYLFYIVEEVQRRGMPTEIALLPMIESAYNPQAYSRSQAAGIWQFVPATGKQYGLQQNWWYDGRRDVLASTRSALNYLEKLHRQFGNWELALAAYNCGEGTVSRAISANAAQGLPTDYKNLALPDEARNYVPKLLAVKKIVSEPGKYGLALLHVPNVPYFTTIDMRRHMDTKLAAEFALMSVNDFTALNPGYNKPVISGHSPHIVLPVDRVEPFVRSLSQYPHPLLSWQVYQAQHGQTLDDIARRFNTSAGHLRAYNPIDEKRNKLNGAHTLLVPIAFKRAAEPVIAPAPQIEVSPAAESIATHTVVQGDSLYAIARRYGMNVDDLMAINGLTSNALKLGQIIRLQTGMATQNKTSSISAPAATGTTASGEAAATQAAPHSIAVVGPPSQPRIKTYMVQYGDTVYGIARQFGVAMADLLSLNNLSASHTLKPGMMMKISSAN
ncbi:MAG: LysM peptidoglycan-binding domain-containing protein [Burkholderiales bacterium]